MIFYKLISSNRSKRKIKSSNSFSMLPRKVIKLPDFNLRAFLFPNENSYHFQSIIEANKENCSTYIGVGTFRCLFESLMGEFSQILFIDISDTVVAFNISHLEVLRKINSLAGLTDGLKMCLYKNLLSNSFNHNVIEDDLPDELIESCMKLNVLIRENKREFGDLVDTYNSPNHDVYAFWRNSEVWKKLMSSLDNIFILNGDLSHLVFTTEMIKSSIISLSNIVDYKPDVFEDFDTLAKNGNIILYTQFRNKRSIMNEDFSYNYMSTSSSF